jgi:FtsP/CotA-like multicopper oxidase with cupredoxin domain
VDLWVVGNEAGYFPSLVGPVRQVLLGPAERYDIILDFSSIPGGALQQRVATDC